MNLELCWNIKARCNQNCEYCHRFLNIKDLNKEDNFIILDKIIKSGIKNLTFTGGEALLIPYLNELIKMCSKNNVKTKLITNSLLFTKSFYEEIKDDLNFLNLSLDSITNKINLRLGRGLNHFDNIKSCINMVKNSQIKLCINSVLTKINDKDIFNLASFLQNQDIFEWRIFRFMPLREKAKKNEENFQISQRRYIETINNLSKQFNINIVTREVNDFENNYLLILANGDIVITKNGVDVVLGNALTDNLQMIINNNFRNK